MKSIRAARRFARLQFALVLLLLVAAEGGAAWSCLHGLNQVAAKTPVSCTAAVFGPDAVFAAMR